MEPNRLVASTAIQLTGPLQQPLHCHPDLLQLDVVINCRGAWLTANGPQQTHGAAAACFYPNQRHGYDLSPLGPRGWCYSFKVRVEPTWAIMDQQPLATRAIPLALQRALQDAAGHVCQLTSAGTSDGPLRMACFCQLLCLWPSSARPPQPLMASAADVRIDPRLRQALALLEKRLDDPPTLRELSAAAHLSPRQLTRLFRQHVGCTPKAYHARYRLVLAQSLLFQPHRSTKIIADELGFSSVHHFSRWFHQHAGLPPGQYRAGGQVL